MIALRSVSWFSFLMIGSVTLMIMACSSLSTPTLPVSDASDTSELPDVTDVPDVINAPEVTDVPDAPSLESQSNEELFRNAMIAMHNLQSFRVKLNFEEQDGEDIEEGTQEGEQSGEKARSITETRQGDVFGDYGEFVCIAPYIYSRESRDGQWNREGIKVDNVGCSFPIASSLVIFPHIGLPLRLYDAASFGIDKIGDVPTRHLRVKVDWAGIGNWLKWPAASR